MSSFSRANLLRNLMIGAATVSGIASGADFKKPNIVVFFADDISAREIPLYGSSQWSSPQAESTSDLKYRAKMPVLDKIANDGIWIKNFWGATVCNPSRAMMMTGRWAYQTKWWNNKDKGYGPDENGDSKGTWPVYMSSPLTMGVIAQKAGYATMWSGKTQMGGDYARHGFDEGCFTPGGMDNKDNPFTDFKHLNKKVNGKPALINVDTGEPCKSYMQHGWYWAPHVRLMNHPSAPGEEVWWPNTAKSKREFGIHTYGPDVELDFCFDFMERKVKEKKPFLVYHTTHLGHDAFNWLDPEGKQWGECKWPNAPIVTWDGQKYTRVTPKITGDKGVYDTHGTITEPGIHNMINYIDYQVWLYQNKFKELGIEDNTIFIFSADNGTSGFGKNSGVQQKGCHIPLVIYAPGMSKKGEQDIIASLADITPTIAELIGFEYPSDYKVDGKSLVPYLFGDAKDHRDWVYSYRGPEQLIRTKTLLKDGGDKWYDTTKTPEDIESYPEIKSWKGALETQHADRKTVLEQLPKYDLYYDEYNAPGVTKQPTKRPRYLRKDKADKLY